jgi:hypothetical protein
MSPTELRLRNCLADGPRNSREVIAEMAASGYSAKQVRRARERQGVVARRSGCRGEMRSTWELPRVTAPEARGDDRHEGDGQRHLDERGSLSEAERARLHGRIAAFIRRGLGADEARNVANALVVRDRGNVQAVGSCIECQAFERLECPAVPRPAIEIHQCWYRRAAGP